MDKWEAFIADSLQGKLGAELQRSLREIPVEHRNSLNIVIKRAVQYGGMSDEEITDVVDGSRELT